MKLITSHVTDDGRRLEVYDAESAPPSMILRADAPGERAVSAPLPLASLAAIHAHFLGQQFAAGFKAELDRLQDA